MTQNHGKHGIYVASELKFAPHWRQLRDGGWPIISSWIDLDEELTDWTAYAALCETRIKEASSAALFILWEEEDELSSLEGFVEMGAAIASGTPVIHVNPHSDGFACPLARQMSKAEFEAAAALVGAILQAGGVEVRPAAPAEPSDPAASPATTARGTMGSCL